jgi:photosystem II stability/assembly factor-like uncharacterized protein
MNWLDRVRGQREPRLARRRLGRVGVRVLLIAVAICVVACGSARPDRSGADRPASASSEPASSRLALAASLANALRTISFLGPQTGYGFFQTQGNGACMDAVAKTVDGGARFTAPVRVVRFGCNGFAPVSALAFDAYGDGFLYGPRLFVSHDGGRRWTRRAMPGAVIAVSAIGRSVWMLEDVCTAGRSRTGRCPVRLLVSLDGGRTWVPSRTLPSGATVNPDLAQSGANGQSWLVRVSGSAGYLLSDPTDGKTLGGRTAPLWYTDDSGASWVARRVVCAERDAFSVVLSAAADGSLVAVCAGEPTAGFQPKSSSVSTNGGRTWAVHGPCTTDYACKTGVLSDGYLGEVDAVTADTAYVIGPRNPLVFTHDGGLTWHVQTAVGYGNGSPAQVVFFDRADGVVIGRPNTATAPVNIWRTSNAGETWTAVTPTVS